MSNTQTKQVIKNAAAWYSNDLYQSKETWQYRLNQDDLNEIAHALAHLKAKRTNNYQVKSEDFPLNKLGKKLKEIDGIIENGTGVFLLRGIPVNQYDISDTKMIYAGLMSYIGTPMPQSKAGELIGDVGDLGKKLTDKTGRGTTTKDPLPFHTDRSDIVTLLCLHQAKSGGASRVVSAVTIHNEIAKNRPDLLELLYQPYYHARVAWETEGEKNYYPLPVFSTYEGNFAVRYLRNFINLSQDIREVPKMSEAQIEALNLVEKLADDPRLCADMEFEPGDMQILNNFVSLHSRAGYEDDEKQKRHLLRMWLSAHNSRSLPPSFAVLYGKTEAGVLRGGVPVALKNFGE